MYLGGHLAPFIHCSILIETFSVGKMIWAKLQYSYELFDKLKNLTNLGPAKCNLANFLGQPFKFLGPEALKPFSLVPDPE